MLLLAFWSLVLVWYNFTFIFSFLSVFHLILCLRISWAFNFLIFNSKRRALFEFPPASSVGRFVWGVREGGRELSAECFGVFALLFIVTLHGLKTACASEFAGRAAWVSLWHFLHPLSLCFYFLLLWFKFTKRVWVQVTLGLYPWPWQKQTLRPLLSLPTTTHPPPQPLLCGPRCSV